MWGRGPRGNNANCSALGQLSVTSPISYQQIGPVWCWFPGVWACVSFRTLWVSPTNSSVRLGVSPTATTPTGLRSQRFWGFLSPHWTLGCAVCLAPQSFLPVYPHSNVGPPGPPAAALPAPVLQLLPCHMSSPPWLPVSVPPTGLSEYFFFNSLVVEFPYSSIFWQFWLFFVSKFVVLLLVVRGDRVYPPLPPSWPEVLGSHFLKLKVHQFPSSVRHKDGLTSIALCWPDYKLNSCFQNNRKVQSFSWREINTCLTNKPV